MTAAAEAAPVLTFDPDQHEYRLNGVVVPSVTQVIGDLWPELYADSPRAAMERGSIVHEATSLDDEGTLNEEAYLDRMMLDAGSPESAALGYLEAWRRFKRESGFVVELNEARVWAGIYAEDRVIYYAGTLDRVGILNGERVLIDLKTGDCDSKGRRAAVRMQTAAYEGGLLSLSQAPTVDARHALKLSSDGSYRLTPAFRGSSDFNDFAAFLRTWSVQKGLFR